MSVAWHNLLFWVLAVSACGSALAVVLTQNIVRMAFWLLIALAAVGGLFFLLGADFVGATQLLIYVGGTLVLLIFGVMLTASGPFVSLKTGAGGWVLAAVVGGSLLAVVLLATTSPGVEWSGVTRHTLTIPAHATEAVPLRFDAADLRGVYVHSDQAVTLRTYDSKRPGDTHELPADGTLVWAADPKPTSTALGLALLGPRGEEAASQSAESRPFAASASSLAITNESDETAHVEIRFFSAAPTSRRARTGYLLPFEIASVHLLVVLIGAAYLARAKRRADRPLPDSVG